MFRRNRLVWEAKDFNVLEASDGHYKYVVFTEKKDGSAQLRFVRYDQLVEGIGIPFYDFALNTRDTKSAIVLADKINRLFRKSRRYNGLVTL